MKNGEKIDRKIKCPLCGIEFKVSDAEKSCKGCFMNKICSAVCCPNCGYKIAL